MLVETITNEGAGVTSRAYLEQGDGATVADIKDWLANFPDNHTITVRGGGTRGKFLQASPAL